MGLHKSKYIRLPASIKVSDKYIMAVKEESNIHDYEHRSSSSGTDSSGNDTASEPPQQETAIEILEQQI